MSNRTKFATIWLGLVLFLPACNALFAQGSYLNIMGIIRGGSLGSQFGKKVVPAGDVNGDTLPDFLVGAFHCCPTDPCCPPPGAQKVYLFHGKKGGLDTVPDMVFDHKAQLEWLGDINGDRSWDFAMRESGQKYRLSLYLGGSVLDTIPDGYVKGDSSGVFLGGDAFGTYVVVSNVLLSNVSAGKISDTGDVQILVGDQIYNLLGRAYAYNGIGNCFDSLAFCHVESLRTNGFFGGQVQILGDVNGDAFKDFAIGYPTNSSSKKGEVRIFLGGTVFDKLPDTVLRPPPFLTGISAGNFGANIAPCGDLNADGLDEFVIGNPRTALLYFGGNPLDTLPRFALNRIGDHFVNGGDINGDGYDDLLVGRDEYPITGFAYVYYGGPSMDSIVDLEIRELDLPFPARGFGQTVTGLGDVDGDGANDFAVGSTSNTDPDRGYLWVFNGLLPSTDVEGGELRVPRSFSLQQNYPNPFNSSTVISYSLSRRSSVRLEVFNIAGQTVNLLVNQEQSAGIHKISWDGTDALGKPVSSGVYLYRLTADGGVETRKMTLIR